MNAGAKRAFIVFDLPYGTYSSAETAVASTIKVVHETGIQMVKLEGHFPEVVKARQFYATCHNAVVGSWRCFSDACICSVKSFWRWRRSRRVLLPAWLHLNLFLLLWQAVSKHAAVCCHLGLLPQTATSFASTGKRQSGVENANRQCKLRANEGYSSSISYGKRQAVRMENRGFC